MIREFRISNSVGQEYDLNNLNLFGYEPEGLGVSFSNGYIATGTSFIPSVQTLNQGQLSLKMLFGAIKENAYLEYKDFVTFLNYQPYTLSYTTDAGEYFRTCQLNSITKSEITIGRSINETMVLDYITPWYMIKSGATEKEVIYDMPGDGKIYQWGLGMTRASAVDIIGDPQFNSLFQSNGSYWKMIYSSDRQYLTRTNQVYQQGYDVIKFDSRITSGNKITFYPMEFSYYTQGMSSLSNYSSVVFEMTINLSSADNITRYMYIYPMTATGAFVPCTVLDNRGQLYGKYIQYALPSSVTWFTIKIAFMANSTTPNLRRFDFETERASVVLITAPKLIVEPIEIPPPPVDPPPPPVDPGSDVPNFVPYQPYIAKSAHHIYSYVYEEEEPNPIYNLFTIYNDSKIFSQKVMSPIFIEISAENGEVVNPSWDVYSNGELISNDGYNLTIPSGGKLMVSSFPDDQYAILYDQDFNKTNVYQYQDMTKKGFVTLAQGQNDIAFNVGTGVVSYRMREEYLII